MHSAPASSEVAQERFLPKLLSELCVEFNATLFLEPQHGYVGYLDFPTGKRWFFRGTSFDLNPQGASAIAKDKDYCANVLSHLGYNVPKGVLLFSPRYKREMRLRNEVVAAKLGFAEAALQFQRQHGFPLFLKPNEGSEGRGVAKATSVDELFDILWWLFDEDDKILLQVPITGRDFRIVVLDGHVVSAYERRPLAVTGDGQSTIGMLLDAALSMLRSTKRGSKITTDDPRIATELRSQNLSMDSVVEMNRRVPLLPNANLSTGGEAVDLSDKISSFYSSIAVSAAKDLGLTLAGIDLLAEDIAAHSGNYCILEVNSAPGLNNFAGSSREAERRTRELYRLVLTKMSQM